MDGKLATIRKKTENVRDHVVKLPAIVVIGPFLAWERRPLRRPDLRRLARSAEFRALDDAAAAWTWEHFRRIEAAAPWLDRAGDHVLDFCSCEILRDWGPPPQWRTAAVRETTVFYGFDGDLADRLDALAGALGSVGWHPDSGPSWWLRETSPSGSWNPVAGFACPPALEQVRETKRYTDVSMSIAWSSRQATGEDPGLGPDMKWRPGDLTAASPGYWPVALVGGDSAAVARTVSQAGRHQHQAAIRIELVYIPSAGFTRRMPKSLLPHHDRRYG
jgi:hypothetical protein